MIMVSIWNPNGSELDSLKENALFLGIGAYVLIRAYLLVEAFVGLCSVPVNVYWTVNWAAYIPHV
jgi:hypothetical protein